MNPSRTYDLCIVGAGLTAATICSVIKKSLRVLVLDVRPYVGGNCHDYRCGNTYVHLHGPHNYHSPNDRITKYLSQYTTWVPFEYKVRAQVWDQGILKHLPFPVSSLTENELGRSLSDDDIIKLFYRGYSEKMWGLSWEQIPDVIRLRVPKRITSYYPENHFQALPNQGYTHMIEQMLDGAEIMLGVDVDAWRYVDAKKIVYCGRIDRFASHPTLTLGYRNLDIEWWNGEWVFGDCHAVNFCHHTPSWTRGINWNKYGDGSCYTISRETPCAVNPDEVAPYYTIPTEENLLLHRRLVEWLPDYVYPAGRIGTYQYMDMWQAVKAALDLTKKIISHD